MSYWTENLDEDRDLARSLRPRTLAEFTGQEKVVDNLRLAVAGCRSRQEPLDHVLLCGPPGLGKTTLAQILAQEMGSRIMSTSGPALDRPRDLVGILTRMERGDLLFLDEVHRLPRAVEEYLYAAMEDHAIDVTIDQGPAARVVHVELQPFTLVAATTREGLLSSPFRGRFGLLERLDPYPPHHLEKILVRAATLLDTGFGGEGARELARRSRGIPRVALRFLRRARDEAQVHGDGTIDEAVAARTLARLAIDERGLEEMDRRLLGALARAEGRPLGLKTLAAAVAEAEDTIEEVYEPYLIRLGFLEKTPKGRTITPAGRRHIGLEGRTAGGESLFDR